MTGQRLPRTFDGVEYAPGQKYTVLIEGLTLSGMVPSGNSSWTGWRQQLQVGDVLTCLGYGPGWGSDPGYGVEWTSEEAKAVRAVHCEINPSVGGAWAYRPREGAVAPVEESVGSA